MLHITKGVEAQVIFTGYELATLTDPNYLFIFTSATEEEIKFVPILFFIETNRYQKALILDTQFADAEAGTWRYRIREQVSSTNTDEALSGNIVEEGFMYLDESTTFAPIEYNEQDNEFKTYDGE
jgi:hypothetical protein